MIDKTELFEIMNRGDFTPLGDEDFLREIRLFIECLNVIKTTIVCDHILNLLEELEGTLPDEKQKLLKIIDNYFALPRKERLIYSLGRRIGIYRRLDDLSDRHVYLKLKEIVDKYEESDLGKLDSDLSRLMHDYI